MQKAFLTGLWVLLSFQLTFGNNNPEVKINTGSPGWADSLLNSMTLDEKIGQLFMIAGYSNRDLKYQSDLINTIKKYHIGGICFFQGGPVRQVELTNRIQQSVPIPLLIAMDAEWGAGMRLDSVDNLPYAMTMGAVQDNRLIYNVAAKIAQQLKLLGVQINFGPDADINNNPENSVINYRSFGETRTLVAEKATAYMMGLQDNGIISVAKHFPGHGDTNVDSHSSLPTINHSLSYLDSVEFFPFKQLIKSGIKGIMAGHLNIPSLDPVTEPASVSAPIIQGILRSRLGFSGLVFTDAMNMKAVAGKYAPGEAEAMALEAGVDIILLPDNIPAAIEAIKEAIRSKKIKKSDLDMHVKKILLIKQEHSLTGYNAIDVRKVNKIKQDILTRSVNELVYQKAITVFQDPDNFLPITLLDTNKFASLCIGDDNDVFTKTLNEYASFHHFKLESKIDEPEEFTELTQQLKNYNVIVVGIHSISMSRSSGYGIDKDDLVFLRGLTDHAKVIIVLFGIPYSASYFSSFSHVVCAYEDNRFTESLVPQALFGAVPIQGKTPVSVSDSWNFGTGITRPAIGRLGFSFPETVGFNLDYLNYIDTIVTEAIHAKATPGCRVLIAKDGKIIFNRSYGFFTYDSIHEVAENSIYDLASITKVAATLQAVMFLEERKIIDLDKKISCYLPELRNTNKENIILRDLLTHQAGLKRYIPFWKNTIESKSKKQYYFSSTMSARYPQQIAPGIFANRSLSDSLWSWVINSPIRDKLNSKPYNYRYSDISFYILFKMVEKIINQPLDEFLKQNLYDPLGLTSISYLPAANYYPETLVPSTVVKDYRNEMLQGYVQDEQAALFGGVAGHAGLFSDAHDLAVLMQMQMQGGYYGGYQYYKPETINEFTHQQYRLNRRGLGWDKPNSSDENLSPASGYTSSSSFGHTGFTGTMIWADPEKNLVYVFLSNRTYPDMDNQKLNELDVRKRIQTVIYSALLNH